MRKRDGNDHQEHQQHGAQAIGTRSVPAIENSHSRLVEGRSIIARADTTMGLEKSAVKTIRTVCPCRPVDSPYCPSVLLSKSVNQTPASLRQSRTTGTCCYRYAVFTMTTLSSSPSEKVS